MDLIKDMEIIRKGCLKECLWLGRYPQQAIIYATSLN